MLHHDAITGTHFEIVENSYNEIIRSVYHHNEKRLSVELKERALNQGILIDDDHGRNLFRHCHQEFS